MGETRCQANVEDFDHPAYHAPMQRITVPGRRRCSRASTATVGGLCLCAVHARLAREGFVDPSSGDVTPKLTISDCRRYGIPAPNRWRCARCGGPVEEERLVYAQPTCYTCLPPPEPLKVVDSEPS